MNMESTEGKSDKSPFAFVRSVQFQTFAICASFISLGAAASVPGPTLIDLRKQVDASVETVTYTISGRSAGSLLGSICGGFIFDHTNHHLFLSFAMILTCITSVLIPLSNSVLELAAYLALQGIAAGCSDTCGNAMILELWGKKSGPYIQTLHFSFAVGAFVAPIIAQPLLSKSIDILVSNASSLTNSDGNAFQHRQDKSVLKTPRRNSIALNANLNQNTNYSSSIARDCFSPVPSTESWTESHIMFAYIAIGIMALFCAVPFFATFLKEGKCFCSKTLKGKMSGKNSTMRQDSPWFKVPFVIILALFYVLYVGLELSFGSLVTTFGFDTLHWPKHDAAHLSTVYWGFLSATRGLSIVVSKFLSSTVMIIIDLSLMVLSTALMSFLSNKYNIVMWICTAVYGLGMASVAPAGISWAERYVHISGKTASALGFGSATGAFVLPALFGHFFEVSGMYFVYMSLGGAVGNVILFSVVYVLAGCHGERYISLPQDELEDDGMESTEL